MMKMLLTLLAVLYSPVLRILPRADAFRVPNIINPPPPNVFLGGGLLAGGAAAAAAATLVAGPLATAAVVATINNVPPMEIYQPPPDGLKDLSVLITGGTTGLGLETAKRLALGGPQNLIVTARTDEKGEAAVFAIREYLSENGKDGSNINVSYRVLDLDDVKGIQSAVDEWFSSPDFPTKLDCLINNAGIMNVPTLELTVDGIERTMASNHLGHFVLTQSLFPKLSHTARIINVSSSAHQFARVNGGMDFDYCWNPPKPSDYNPSKSYGQSKLANILFSQELQRRSDDAGYQWDVACLHPGVVNTELFTRFSPQLQRLQTNLPDQQELPGFVASGIDAVLTKSGDLNLFKTVAQGATTSVWLASGAYRSTKTTTEDDINFSRTNAQYYDNCKPQRLAAFATDKDAAKQLWEESEERTGISFAFFTNDDEEEESITIVRNGIEVDKEILDETTTEETAKGEGDDSKGDDPGFVPIETMTVKELKDVLRSRGLKVSGNKKELQARIWEEVLNEDKNTKESDEDNLK